MSAARNLARLVDRPTRSIKSIGSILSIWSAWSILHLPSAVRAEPVSPCLGIGGSVAEAFRRNDLTTADSRLASERPGTLVDACRREIDSRVVSVEARVRADFPVKLTLDGKDPGEIHVWYPGRSHEITLLYGDPQRELKLKLDIDRKPPARRMLLDLSFVLPTPEAPRCPPPQPSRADPVTLAGSSTPPASSVWPASPAVGAVYELALTPATDPDGGAETTVFIDGQAAREIVLSPERAYAVEITRADSRRWAASATLTERAGRQRLNLTPVMDSAVPRRRWPAVLAGVVAAASLGGYVWQARASTNAEGAFNAACRASTTGSCDVYRDHLADSERARGRRDVLGVTTLAATALFVYLLGWGS